MKKSKIERDEELKLEKLRAYQRNYKAAKRAEKRAEKLSKEQENNKTSLFDTTSYSTNSEALRSDNIASSDEKVSFYDQVPIHEHDVDPEFVKPQLHENSIAFIQRALKLMEAISTLELYSDLGNKQHFYMNIKKILEQAIRKPY